MKGVFEFKEGVPEEACRCIVLLWDNTIHTDTYHTVDNEFLCYGSEVIAYCKIKDIRIVEE